MDRERAAGQETIDIWRTETEQSRAPIFFLFRVTLVDRGPLQKPCSDHRHPPPPQNAPPKRPQNRSRPARGARFTTGLSAHTPTPGRRRAGAIPWAAAAATRAWRWRRASNFTRASRAHENRSKRTRERAHARASARESERTRERDFSSQSCSPLPLFSLSSSSLRLGPVTAEIAAHMPTTSSNTGFILRGKERKLEAGRAR
jgi:hypothetical protein